MIVTLISSTQIGLMCVVALVLGIAIGHSFRRRGVANTRSAIQPAEPTSGTPIPTRVSQLLEGSTISIDPGESAQVLDAILENSLVTPGRKFVLRFEIWPASTRKWLVSALSSEAQSSDAGKAQSNR